MIPSQLKSGRTLQLSNTLKKLFYYSVAAMTGLSPKEHSTFSTHKKNVETAQDYKKLLFPLIFYFSL